MKSISMAVSLAFVACVAGAATYSFPTCPTPALVPLVPPPGPVSDVVLQYSFPVSGGGSALDPTFVRDGLAITIFQDVPVNPIADIEIPPKCATQTLNVGPLGEGVYVVSLRVHHFDTFDVGSPPRDREYTFTFAIGQAAGPGQGVPALDPPALLALAVLLAVAGAVALHRC